MPFLRFTRDKRGYETTSLVDAGRHNGRSPERILYWFRTPPGVKVGRAALDPDAIRWIEEHNSDIEFDWSRIFEAQPPAAAPPDDGRGRRSRRDRPRTAPPAPPRLSTSASERPGPPAPEPAELAPVSPDLLQSDLVPEPEQEVEPELDANPLDPEDDLDPVIVAGDQPLGREPLTRLRARYAELLTRIAERGGDAERVQGLRAQAESLNPDSWMTSDDVRVGVEAFEQKIRDLRAALGLRRRRRSRRGGRRRRPDAGKSDGSAPAGPPEPPSNEGE